MAIGDGFKGCLQIGVGLDIVQLACLYQGGNARPASTALVLPGKERVFAIKGNGTNGPLDGVAVDLKGAI